MGLTSDAVCDLPDNVRRVLLAAANQNDERRREQRESLFTRVTLLVPRRGARVRYACFSRDVSASGMGLIHHFPVTPGDVGLVVHLPDGESLSLAGEIVWCMPAGNGWYLSGVRFLPEDSSAHRCEADFSAE